MSSTRQKVATGFINDAVTEFQKEFCRRINEKGDGGFTSCHEILGVVTEEYDELLDAVQSRATLTVHDLKSELLDIAVACVFGAACINAEILDW